MRSFCVKSSFVIVEENTLILKLNVLEFIIYQKKNYNVFNLTCKLKQFNFLSSRSNNVHNITISYPCYGKGEELPCQRLPYHLHKLIKFQYYVHALYKGFVIKSAGISSVGMYFISTSVFFSCFCNEVELYVNMFN